MEVVDLGLLSFAEAREVQERYIESRRIGECDDTLILCEHPPTLSLGKRTKQSDLGFSEDIWRRRGVEVVRVNRGGAATLHLPGQLLIYPVVSLRERKLGIRRFVEQGLLLIARYLEQAGLEVEVALEPAGVWVRSGRGELVHSAKKIAAVGLAVDRGITNHGFSVNLNCDLSLYSDFSNCGYQDLRVTSVAAELGCGYKARSGAGVSFSDFCENSSTLSNHNNDIFLVDF